MAHAQIDDYSSDDNGQYMLSNEDAESEDSSCNDTKKRLKKLNRPVKSKSSGKKRGRPSRKRSLRRKDSTESGRRGNATDDSKSKECDNIDSDPKDDIKQELVSDEIQSVISDINPPSLSTRLRRRRRERRSRGTASSTSSAFDSDARKTRSEPILITIDSDSGEDSVSTISVRPNRTARIHGEIVRKYGRLTRSNVRDTKYSESSSSDEGEKNKRKSKKKARKAVPSSSKAEKYSPNPFKSKKQLNVKRHVKSRVVLYSPMKQKTRRLKIQNIRKRLERKKKVTALGKHSELFLKRTSSRLSVNSSERRRIPRRCSTTGVQGTYFDKEMDIKNERPKRKVSSNLMKTKIKEESEGEKVTKKKTLDNSDIEDDIRKIISTPKPSIDVKPVKTNADIKSTRSTPETRNSPKANLDSKNLKPETDKESTKISDELESNSNIENNSEKKDEKDPKEKEEKDSEMKLEEKPSKSVLDSERDERKLNIEEDLEKIRMNTPDTMAETSLKSTLDEEKNSNSGGLQTRAKIHKGPPHKKKKIKTVIQGVIRKRGRPRLSESNQNSKPSNALALYHSKSQIAFLQDTFCFEVASKLSKCRECRIALHRNNRRMNHSYCRFMEYRKLCFNKNGQICNAGFSNPTDATSEHLSLWLPQPQDPPKDLDFDTAKSLLEHIGDQFCDLIEQEKEALSLHIGLQQVMTWKRIVQGVREMCDVCSTTIFNIHWVCPICGFSVCIDCYKVRKQGIVAEDEEEQPRDRDEYKWLLCTMRQPHEQDSLVMTQMIPGNALWIMRDLLHKARIRWGIPSYCKCTPQMASTPDKIISSGINKQLMSCVTKSFTSERNHSFSFERNSFRNDIGYDDLDVEVSGAALRWLEGASVHGDNISNNNRLSEDQFNSYEDFNILSNSLLSDGHGNASESEYDSTTFSLDDIISCVTNCQSDTERHVVKHFSQRYPQPNSGRDPLPIRIYTKIESELAFSDVPHSWFCNGRLLFLHQPNHKDNLTLFQEQWKRGQPIMVKNVQKGLDMNLWRPESFCRDFGEVKNDLVDCKTGMIIPNLPMRKFWEGFENFGKRLTDESGEYRLLKLKDWPPGEDFSEKLPNRFDDLMKGLPLPEYTHRNGILNLAGRLPSSFVRPDLGPKMYNAYGSALYPTKGTTNLHLDVSDAVNVMVYVGIPSDGNTDIHVQEALKAIDEGGCDSLMRQRVRQAGSKPGALWHIYNARDTDKIRDMLTKVALERGEKLEAHHDPIHDQSWYIDAELRLRLYREYGVEGYAIAQCLGDAVFIPAGAPHQVRNLHSCVKVAEDFVSPENIAHCFKLTQEFRNLSDTHTNHEDKLQIKNIIYHVIRDSLSHLLPENEPLS